MCSGLWRSEDMVRLDLILQREALHDTVLEVGMLGKAQFIDLNEGVTAFARPFTNDVRRCEDIQRKMRAIEEEFAKEPSILAVCMAGSYQDDYDMSASVADGRSHFSQAQLDMLDDRVESTMSELMALVSSEEGIHNEMNYDQELRLLNGRLRTMLDRARDGRDDGIGVSSVASLARLPTLVGVVAADKMDSLTRVCFRISRGNAIVEVTNEAQRLVDPKTGIRNIVKASFIIISSSPRMVERLRKMVVALGATIYGVDEIISRGDLDDAEGEGGVGGGSASADADEGRSSFGPHGIRRRRAGAALAPGSAAAFGAAAQQSPMAGSGPGAGSRASDAGSSSPTELSAALANVERRKRDLLARWYAEHRLYKVYLKVEKAVLTTMNMCALSGSTCTASLWIPTRHEEALQRSMDDAVASSGSAVHSIMSRHLHQKRPPTYFETNKFTSSFQGIVDSYGMARYKETNPGVFTTITFPYLFGIMFGDIGHGIILLLISIFFITKEKSWRAHQLPEILAMIFEGRYLLLLMSLFAIYMGVLYNDFFGFSLNIFPSGYTWAPIASQSGITFPLEPNGNHSIKPKRVYAVGLDAAWAETENKLEFYNSVKMKCAVIVGVVQMFAGLFLSLNNYIYQRNWSKIALRFVPEFVFLTATFGYMSTLIIVKWCTTWENTNDAPSILEIMTNFFLQPGTVPQPPLFKGQASLQVFLLIIAFLVVPVLLLGMPIVEMRAYKRWRKFQFAGDISEAAQQPGDHSSGTFDPFGDVLPPPNSEQTTSVEFFSEQSLAARRHREHNSDIISTDGSVAGDDFFGPSSEISHSAGADAVDVTAGATGDGGDIIAVQREEDDERFTDFDMSELMIHYIIHTIEYVLSSVSNTASYLRLWALSLAHAQLSEVFLTFAVVNLLNLDTTGFLIGFGVFAWLGVTLGVLVGMEALSAFLHALRLHWVEFQNKFYVGDGVAFEPLNLVSLNYMS